MNIYVTNKGSKMQVLMGTKDLLPDTGTTCVWHLFTEKIEELENTCAPKPYDINLEMVKVATRLFEEEFIDATKFKSLVSWAIEVNLVYLKEIY